jgi:hypothetical protein
MNHPRREEYGNHPLQEKTNHPRIRKWPPVVDWSGDLGCMDYAAAIMFHLGNVLLPDDEKVRVTIERDPETERFTIKREVIT